MLAVLVLSTLSGFVFTVPRALYWLPLVMVAAIALLKAARFAVGLVAVMTALVVVMWFVDQAVSRAWNNAIGYDTSLDAISIPALVAAFGVAPLACVLCCLADGHARSVLGRWIAPLGALDVTRVAVVVLVAVTAVFPLARSFTTGSWFGLVVPARDQVLFPGYASPGQVADGMREEFSAAGAPVTSVECSYFAPNLGAPPVYNCTAVLDTGGRLVYHDNLQSTGRPDGTFTCSDDSEGVSRRLC